MVLLHIKIHEKSQFWYKAFPTDNVLDAIHQIILIYNDRIKLSLILNALQEDKTERHNFKEILLKLVTEIESFLGQKIFEAGSCLTSQDSSQLLQKARKVLETVFSTPLPLHLIDILETTTEEMFHDANSTLWFAGKEMKRDKPLSEYVGKNEKSKVIVKLQKSSAGPPLREGKMSAEEEKQVMLHMFRRNQELQRLEEDDDLSGSSRQSGDSQSLRRAFQGLGTNIRWKPE